LDFNLDQLADDAAVAAAVSEIVSGYIPVRESPEIIERRIAEHQAREEHARARRDAERERAAFERAREMERTNQANRAAAQRETQEKYEQRRRESDAALARERLALVEQQQRAELLRRQHAAREQSAAAHWRELDELAAGLSRLLEPPPRDPNAERIAALEYELALQADQQAADAERARSTKYQAEQRAAVARREADRW
jgi:hypothetical protein